MTLKLPNPARTPDSAEIILRCTVKSICWNTFTANAALPSWSGSSLMIWRICEKGQTLVVPHIWMSAWLDNADNHYHLQRWSRRAVAAAEKHTVPHVLCLCCLFYIFVNIGKGHSFETCAFVTCLAWWVFEEGRFSEKLIMQFCFYSNLCIRSGGFDILKYADWL